MDILRQSNVLVCNYRWFCLSLLYNYSIISLTQSIAFSFDVFTSIPLSWVDWSILQVSSSIELRIMRCQRLLCDFEI